MRSFAENLYKITMKRAFFRSLFPTRGIMSEINRIQSGKIAPQAQTPAVLRTKPNGPPSDFAEILKARQGLAPQAIAPEVRFSAHAQTRLQSRQIPFNAAQQTRLQNAVQKAAGKGARDALVLMDNLALVVNVPNRTVVTVADKDQLKQNVFTNIDSAVIA